MICCHCLKIYLYLWFYTDWPVVLYPIFGWVSSLWLCHLFFYLQQDCRFECERERGLGWHLLSVSGRNVFLLWSVSFSSGLALGVMSPDFLPPTITALLCFCHLWGAVSSWLWQVAVWNPPLGYSVLWLVLGCLWARQVNQRKRTT